MEVWNLSWLIQRLSWLDLFDILLVAGLFFWLFYALRGTRAAPLVRGITALLVTLALLSRIVRLRAFSWVVAQLLPALLIAIPVIFQPELRRALARLGRGRFFSLIPQHEESSEKMLAAVLTATHQMAAHKVGALIVFERETGLQDYVDTGVPVDARVTVELLTTIFDHHTILHDGAVIIRDNRIAAAACVMPLTTAFLSDRHLGLRHRAAIGTTEESDAVAVVVSEERGNISVTHNGRIMRDLDGRRLESVLRAFLLPEQPTTKLFFQRWWRREPVKPSASAEGGQR
ncbi:MAG: TIGR00159 family protein [Chloroflexi bacterium]|nr:MAG: TIGR00159 family protein [Chloroflexota bacterium]